MLNLIKDFFSTNISIDRKDTEENIEHHIQIATCALLIEMASIDEEFNKAEKDRIVNHLKHDYKLEETEVKQLFSLAEKELSNRIDLWSFTNLINQNYSIEQKLKVIETVWEVIYADGKLSAHEDYLIHKLYKMLNLPHSKLIDVKMKVLNKYKNKE